MPESLYVVPYGVVHTAQMRALLSKQESGATHV
jgi:hypothetical protein